MQEPSLVCPLQIVKCGTNLKISSFPALKNISDLPADLLSNPHEDRRAFVRKHFYFPCL